MALQKWLSRIEFYIVAILMTIGGFVALANAQSATAVTVGRGGSDRSAESAAATVDADGAIEILHEDFNNHSGRYLYFLKTSDGRRVRLHFAKHPPASLLTGDHVRVRGRQSGGTLILASGGGASVMPLTAQPSSLAPLPNTLGAQNAAVILVNFQNNPTAQPWTLGQVQNAILGTASNYLHEVSYQQTWLTGTVYGWYTIPLDSTNCDTSAIATDANNAATAAGVNLSGYTRFIYAFPPNTGCGFAGAGTIGGSPSQSWLNNHIDSLIVPHELGHNLGLYHSHARDCGSAIIGNSCSSIEYGDVADVMGNGAGHYNAFQKERLGWLTYGASPPIITVTASGIYTLDPYELYDSNTKALKILKSIDPTTGLSTWYYVEYRQPLGFDSSLPYLGAGNLTQGVTVHVGTDNTPNSSNLLDMTPQSYAYDFNDAALTVGQSFSDPSLGLTLTTQWADTVSAGVNITLAATPTPSPSPTPTPAPSPSPTPSPEPSPTPSLTPTPTPSPTPTPAPTPTPLEMTVSTNQSSYSPGAQVKVVSVVITSAGSPVSSANVSLTLSKPNGATLNASIVTGTNGSASYTIKLKRSDPSGSYGVAAVATSGGSSAIGATTFTVQ
jgi:hypothetical protein